jgi:UDP-N-acetylglucosamine--N-acetylmuramyl-(pentapeptide) pyrophosphoryl-undecaprenol N-acetylglucosamine transferase
VILVIGGSQGAQAMNNLIWSMLGDLVRRAEIIHIVGQRNYKDAVRVKRSLDTYDERMYHPFDFMTHDLKHAYAAADLVISRAGASSLLDIALTRKPSILVPLPGHQTVNAYEFAKVGAAVVIEEPNFTHHLLLATIEELLSNPALLQDMAGHTTRFATPDAARRIAEELLTLSTYI